MDRFDIPATVSILLENALAVETIDVTELYTLSHKHGTNFGGLVQDILLMAYNNRHVDLPANDRLCRLADDYYRLLPLNNPS